MEEEAEIYRDTEEIECAYVCVCACVHAWFLFQTVITLAAQWISFNFYTIAYVLQAIIIFQTAVQSIFMQAQANTYAGTHPNMHAHTISGLWSKNKYLPTKQYANYDS